MCPTEGDILRGQEGAGERFEEAEHGGADPLALLEGGNIRAENSRILPDSKVSVMAGVQFLTLHEYFSGDTTGALERLDFYGSDVQTSKDASQQYRKANVEQSSSLLQKMFGKRVDHFFPEQVMKDWQELMDVEAKELAAQEVRICNPPHIKVRGDE